MHTNHSTTLLPGKAETGRLPSHGEITSGLKRKGRSKMVKNTFEIFVGN